MARSAPDDGARGARRPQRAARPSAVHVHWFRWSGEDPFGSSSLYTCRCGEVRPAV